MNCSLSIVACFAFIYCSWMFFIYFTVLELFNFSSVLNNFFVDSSKSINNFMINFFSLYTPYQFYHGGLSSVSSFLDFLSNLVVCCFNFWNFVLFLRGKHLGKFRRRGLGRGTWLVDDDLGKTNVDVVVRLVLEGLEGVALQWIEGGVYNHFYVFI